MPNDKYHHLFRFLLLYIHIALAITFSVSLIYFAAPALKSVLLDEDRFLETLSALLGLGAFACALFVSIRARPYKDRRLVWPAFLAAVSLWSFLEEVSYGRRLWGVKAPRVMGVEIDSLHDFTLRVLPGCPFPDELQGHHPVAQDPLAYSPGTSSHGGNGYDHGQRRTRR